MMLSIQIAKFKFYQYQLRAVSPNLMFAKLTRYTILLLHFATHHHTCRRGEGNCNYIDYIIATLENQVTKWVFPAKLLICILQLNTSLHCCVVI